VLFCTCCSLDTETNEVVAIKVINLEEAEEEIDEIRQEITMLSECQSPYVTKYITSYSNGPDLCIGQAQAPQHEPMGCRKREACPACYRLRSL
jgi:hypothetical protein